MECIKCEKCVKATDVVMCGDCIANHIKDTIQNTEIKWGAKNESFESWFDKYIEPKEGKNNKAKL
mgnify:CR=1 FL=1